MSQANGEKLKPIHDELIKIAQAWAGKWKYDPERARELRRQAVLINHAYYLENIPAYRKLAKEEGIGLLDDLAPIKNSLMSTDEIFKSYRQEWLDESDFGKMNEWLSSIFHEPVKIDVEGVKSIDEWIDRLTAGGVIPAYSSGTTGAFSFVPRSELGWKLFTVAPVCYLSPMLMDRQLGNFIQRALVKPAAKILSPDTFASIVGRMGLPDYDGILLNFRKGNMGIQLVGQEFAKMFKNSYFLYPVDLSASALRLITRGAKTDEERKIVDDFKAQTVDRKEENYSRIVEQTRKSTKKGQRVFIFGAPYQLKEMVEFIGANGGTVPLKDRSVIMFGGGWKTFVGEKIERAELVDMISNTFSVKPELVIEGYSMTEINGVLPRCDHGRFHLPPVVEPVILNEDLTPVDGDDVKGAFGFLDPFAVSYPGFIISGDNVRLVTGRCECGLDGPGIMDIERSPGREVKGCGGIMGQIRA